MIPFRVATSDHHTAGEPFRIVWRNVTVFADGSTGHRAGRARAVDPTDPLVPGFVLR